MVLDPLSALSEVVYDDVREKQLDCVQHMLHCWGEQIGTSWLRVIEIIGVIRESYKYVSFVIIREKSFTEYVGHNQCFTMSIKNGCIGRCFRMIVV